MSDIGPDEVGVVVIGRNEGERLKRCLGSIAGEVAGAVYVDSGSTDGSVEYARSIGVRVVELDLSVPFTAARARNAGVRDLLETWPRIAAIQVVDGDCELVADWIRRACAHLSDNPRCAVACGRRRERFPEASVYNNLIDLEWDTPIGPARSCGGDALFRRSALDEVGGYRESMIAGEEPELCYRLRHAGWSVSRLDAEMTIHDAALTRFGQFWKRAKRAGHAYAESAWLHGAGSERFGVKQVLSAVLWGGLLPLVSLLTAIWTLGISLAMFAVMVAVQVCRIRRRAINRGRSSSDATRLAVATLVSKPAQLSGVVLFLARKLTRRRSRLIEYKSGPSDETPGVSGG